MKTTLPLTIDNGHGEVIIFKEIIHEPDGDRLQIEGHVKPNCGPVMHVHYKQDEHFHVVQGIMAYQTPGNETAKLTPGQSTTFLCNQPHKFWNAGDDELVVSSWVKPANNAIFYLSTLYAATNGQKTPNPNPFDGAYLIMKYKSEYGLLELPNFVRNVIIPITYFIGQILGKYKKFQGAPTPVE